jgi:hypothetical protein
MQHAFTRILRYILTTIVIFACCQCGLYSLRTAKSMYSYKIVQYDVHLEYHIPVEDSTIAILVQQKYLSIQQNHTQTLSQHWH